MKNDSIEKKPEEYDTSNNRLISFSDFPLYSKASTTKEFDSIHRSLFREDKMNWLAKPLYRKNIELEEKGIMLDGQFQERVFS